MARLGSWIEVNSSGIHVPAAGIWIDPAHPVDRALVTHGHADHARGGHGRVLTTAETLAIMASRYGPQPGGQAIDYGASLRIGEVAVRFLPAGHVLGSAQIVLDYRGERIVVSGDYKRRPDPTCLPFEPVPCDVFITEATFALPVFRHPEVDGEIGRLLATLAAQPERAILIGAYVLGKAQRIIAELRRNGYDKPLYIHGAVEKLCSLYTQFGMELGEIRPVMGCRPADLKGQIVIAPPSALRDRWSRRLPDPVTAMASGWMRIRQRARQANIELPLVISDHADWDELTDTISEIRPSEVWVTHGREDALIHWCEQNQIKARALALLHREDEDD
jgi:putative mRNA 3-end processing factor